MNGIENQEARRSRLPSILAGIAFALVLLLLGPVGFAIVMMISNPGGSGADPEAKILIAVLVLAAAFVAGWGVRGLTLLVMRLMSKR